MSSIAAPYWTAIVTETGPAEAKGSTVRVNYSDGGDLIFKGNIALQHFPGSQLIRLLYTGIAVDGEGSPVDGRLQRRTVYLPHGVNWHSGQKKLRTLNTMTRVSRIDFGPNCDGIASVQITMPVTGKSDPHGKSVFEAVNTISKTTKPRTFD